MVARILIADDHHVVRHGLRRILQTQCGWKVVAEAANGKDAVAKAVATSPDVAVIDHFMPGMNGLQVTREIRARMPDTEVLIFATGSDDTLAREFLSAGASGYLLKSDANRTLIGAIQSLLARKPFLTPRLCGAERFRHKPASSQEAASLTARERTVVKLIAEGHSNKSTANALNISRKTVETHRTTVMRKLNLSSSAELVRYAIRNHIVQA